MRRRRTTTSHRPRPAPTVLARPTRGADDDAEPVRQLRNLKWGLVPSWAKDPKIGNRMINARAETVHEKPAFRRAFKSRRLLIPVDGFYEWFAPQQLGKSGNPLKQPFYIHPANPDDPGPGRPVRVLARPRQDRRRPGQMADLVHHHHYRRHRHRRRRSHPRPDADGRHT